MTAGPESGKLTQDGITYSHSDGGMPTWSGDNEIDSTANSNEPLDDVTLDDLVRGVAPNWPWARVGAPAHAWGYSTTRALMLYKGLSRSRISF